MACCIFQIICILIIQLWFSPVTTTSNPEENGPDCIPKIMVPRNTVWKASVMKHLKINCTVFTESHCWRNVSVSWCRIDEKNGCRPLNHSNHITIEWKNVAERQYMLFLIFQNISMQDAGLYRCEVNSPTPTVGHAINVTVTDYFPDPTTKYENVSRENNTTNSSGVNSENEKWPQFYVYIYIGTGVLLLIVFVVSVTITRCRRQKRSFRGKIHEDQSTTTSVADLAPPIYNPRETPQSKTQTPPAQTTISSCLPPPYIYDTPPVRAMSLKDRTSPGRHGHGPLSRSHNRANVEEKDDENPLIYASLNHEVIPQRPARVAHVQIEASEYAAIKVT